MAKILLGVTGSVAAIHTRELLEALRDAGHDVKIVATRAALYFFDPTLLDPQQPEARNRDLVILDQDEWSKDRYERGDPVLHIELRRWADALVIAPLDANTLAKLALGICDNCLTCVYRAWDRTKPLVLAPAMNTHMWEHPATARHLAQVAEDWYGKPMAASPNLLCLIDRINAAGKALAIAAPVVKMLACAELGMGAMAGPQAIVNALVTSL